MKLQQRWAVAVLAAMVIFVSNAGAEVLPGKASLGAQVGVPFIMGDSDLKEGQSPRLIGLANFQYVFTPSWRLSTSFGFGWVGYKDGTPSPYPLFDRDTGDSVTVRDDLLTKLVPVNATIIRALKPQTNGWSPYVGVGGNLTRVELVNKKLKVKDPATFDAQASWQPGVHGLVGVEYVLPSNKNVTFDWNARWTQLLKSDNESFPSGFTGKHSYLTVGFGVNVYFWPIGYKPVETATAPAADSLSAPAPAPTEPTPEPSPAPPDTSQAPRDTSQAPQIPSPGSAPLGTVLRAPAPSTTAGTLPAAPANVAPAPAAPKATPAHVAPSVLDLDENEDDEACETTDLRPFLGIPPRPHPAEEQREP